ncbi:branched-chain amino acid ABC transporter permease [Xanthobacter oligotrophicus]|uniref:Branched-chain amino acid ABC transporter permease n=1 Tax=Xanthobacter oligotrophicus TaxID=2607286 RepID=A0ABW6ZTD7_9HYPH
MFYRDAGELKTSYAQEQAIFPVALDRRVVIGVAAVGALVVPLVAGPYWLGSILLPFLILSLAAIGLNILTGYAGQLSLGSGAFMAVGAYAAVNLVIRLPMVPFPVSFVLAGLVAGAVGLAFGLLSLRIRGFYVAVATLAAQFFIEWICTHIPWLVLNTPSGVVSTPTLFLFGFAFSSVPSRYLVAFVAVVVLALLAKNLVRSSAGRALMAVRDHETAAELTGVDTARAKLTAFAVSGFYCGVAGALWSFLYLGTVEIEAFSLHRSFQILFMIIIGGLGSILGSFLGAAFIVLLPVAIANAAVLFGGALKPDVLANLELMIFGALIVSFLIIEPSGLARLVVKAKERLRRWPLAY